MPDNYNITYRLHITELRKFIKNTREKETGSVFPEQKRLKQKVYFSLWTCNITLKEQIKGKQQQKIRLSKNIHQIAMSSLRE